MAYPPLIVVPLIQEVLPQDIKANKTFIVQIFFPFFFLFYKNMHTYTKYGGSWGRHTHTRTLLHTRAHTNTHKYSFLSPGLDLKSLGDCWGGLPVPISVNSPTLFPLSQASPMWGRSQGWSRGDPENRRLMLGVVIRHPWGCAVLLRGDEGLAPLGQEAQDSREHPSAAPGH